MISAPTYYITGCGCKRFDTRVVTPKPVLLTKLSHGWKFIYLAVAPSDL